MFTTPASVPKRLFFSLCFPLYDWFPQQCISLGCVGLSRVAEVRAAEFKSEPQPLQGF